ncbi:NUDIX domain-containing protein [Bacillus mangrovi]|uniref:NUDIX domain-containing protein n=1 Tax=Metabacillus mangrovi TaxID=1491830 RepID=A0A7X2V5A5_9BACI|nr:NUDIX hydrolase [Metabacillus mangrovi]MTH53848.1 NUDIX domain-containing protein [Metabacillus mangrovi]
MTSKRGNVWLAAAGIVTDETGRWLVVKKKYGGLKGKWSLPAGFVEGSETADQAVIREVYEETGIRAKVEGVIGLRSGVIKGQVSDNMIIFKLNAVSREIRIQEEEIFEAAFLPYEQLKNDKDSSLLLTALTEQNSQSKLLLNDQLDPGEQFEYSAYNLFL